MFQALRLSSRLFHSTRTKDSSPAQSKQIHDLDYKNVRDVFILTEVDKHSGKETPLALAYIKEDHGIVVATLFDLSELE